MESETDGVANHELRKSTLTSGLDSSPGSRRLDLAGSSPGRSSSARELAPSEAAKLVGDEVGAVLEAAHVAAAQIRTRAHGAITEAQQKLIECRRALDELSDQLNELTASPGATRVSPPSSPKPLG
jgi:hypothetical protein